MPINTLSDARRETAKLGATRKFPVHPLHRPSCGPTTNDEIPEENEVFSDVVASGAAVEKFQGAIPVDLQAIIDAWETFSPGVKAAFLALVQNTKRQSTNE